jgi:hypothetical protein
MSKQDEPDDSASGEEEAVMRAARRIVSALERGDVHELAAALSEARDPESPWPGSHEPPTKH